MHAIASLKHKFNSKIQDSTYIKGNHVRIIEHISCINHKFWLSSLAKHEIKLYFF